MRKKTKQHIVLYARNLKKESVPERSEAFCGIIHKRPVRAELGTSFDTDGDPFPPLAVPPAPTEWLLVKPAEQRKT